jgi:hypothetical protein
MACTYDVSSRQSGMLLAVPHGKAFYGHQSSVSNLTRPHRVNVLQHLRPAFLRHALEHHAPHNRLEAVAADEDVAPRARPVLERELDRARGRRLRVRVQALAEVRHGLRQAVDEDVEEVRAVVEAVLVWEKRECGGDGGGGEAYTGASDGGSGVPRAPGLIGGSRSQTRDLERRIQRVPEQDVRAMPHLEDRSAERLRALGTSRRGRATTALAMSFPIS